MDEHPKSLQEVFSQVYLGVVAQGAQSSDAQGQCLYRGPNGTKCAVGHLLPDELYHPSMEGMAADCSESIKAALVKVGVDMKDSQTRTLVHRVQMIHDDYCTSESDFTEYFKSAMEHLAKTLTLEIPKWL